MLNFIIDKFDVAANPDFYNVTLKARSNKTHHEVDYDEYLLQDLNKYFVI